MRVFLGWVTLFSVFAGLGQAADKNDRSKIPPTHLEGEMLLKACDVLGKGTSQPTFRTDISCIEVEANLLHVSSPHTLRFLYYQPDGNLYATTRPDWTFGPAQGANYHRLAHVTHRLIVKGEEAAFRVGTWKVAIWLDELHLAETRFQLERPALPLEQNLTEAQQLYRNGEYQKAVDRLNTVINSVHHSGVITESAWWLALAHQALGQAAEAEAALMKLLQSDPTYGPSAASLDAEGADIVRQQLEEVRKREFIDLYVKSVDVPKVDLTQAEDAPVLGRRWPLWKKLLVYGGIPVAAAATAVLVVGGGGETTVAGPPTVGLAFADNASRDNVNAALCTGRPIPLRLSITGGVGPFEAIVTAAKLQSAGRAVRVPGIIETLTTNDTVVLKVPVNEQGNTTIQFPSVSFTTAGPGIAGIRVTVVVRDSESSINFGSATPGQGLPSSISGSIGAESRVIQQSANDVLIQGGVGC